MLLTNKHFIVAMIVTPILAIIAYFATDYVVSEKPHSAVSGESYPLNARSSCRYPSNKCEFRNGDIRLMISALTRDGQVYLKLESQLPIQGVKLALANSAGAGEPQSMNTVGNDIHKWQMTFNQQDIIGAQLLVVASINDTIYYGDTETTFIKTSDSAEVPVQSR